MTTSYRIFLSFADTAEIRHAQTTLNMDCEMEDSNDTCQEQKMGKERGAANLAKWNAERSAPIIPQIKKELKACKKAKLTFKSPGVLAAFLQERVGVHRVTLLRNPNYSTLILEYQNEGLPIEDVPDAFASAPILRSKLRSERLATSNIKAKAAELLKELNEAKSAVVSPSASTDEVAFSNLAMVLVTILNQLPEFLRLDHKKRELHNLKMRPSERLAANSQRLGDFYRWMEQHKHLPQVRNLLNS